MTTTETPRPDIYDALNNLNGDIVMIHIAFSLLSERLNLGDEFWKSVRTIYDETIAQKEPNE